MERRRRTEEPTRLVLDVRAPRWAVWSTVVGLLVLGVSNAAAVVLLLVAP